MGFLIRPAGAGDVMGLIAVKAAVWPQEKTLPEYVIALLDQPERITLVAEVAGVVAGFVDGFLTLSNIGVRRWEVDLLAVQPNYQGRGIATDLVAASTQAGWEMGASLARALIAVENIASQRTFAHCGYVLDPTLRGIWVASQGDGQAVSVPEKLHLIPVHTLNYRGVWLEGQLTPAGFAAANTVRTRYGWDVSGAVIALADTAIIQAATAADYGLVGHYQFWQIHHYG
jgi:GNAT superfamily N-acetyltransferase